MGVSVVFDGDVFEQNVLGVGELYHRARAAVAVEGAALDSDIAVTIALRLVTVPAGDEHVGGAVSPERHAVKRKAGVAVDGKRVAKIVVAGSDDYLVKHIAACVLSQRKRVLYGVVRVNVKILGGNVYGDYARGGSHAFRFGGKSCLRRGEKAGDHNQ